MGHTIWVEIKGHRLGEGAADSSTMLRLIDQLDSLAVKLNVPKLNEFLDYTELETSYVDLLPESEREAVVPRDATFEQKQAKGKWFDSGAGLEMIRALIVRLTENFADLGFTPDQSTQHWPAQLLDELKHNEAMLARAVEEERPFRLSIVP